jgi:hypothetical protein
MKTKASFFLAGLLLCGCANQHVQFSGHVPDTTGTAADTLWNKHLSGRYSERWVQNHAVVRAVRGGVAIHQGDGANNARVGAHLAAGIRLHTDRKAETDLYLAENGPVLRLAEKSTIRLVRLSLWNRGDEKIVDTMIEVEEGRVLGNVKKLAAESSYLLRTRAGVVQIRGTEFEVSADGRCSIIKGAAQVFAGEHSFLVNAGEKFEGGRVFALTDQERRDIVERAALNRSLVLSTAGL